MLTGLDGVEVCRQLRRVNTELAVIVLTALGEENDRIAGLEVGADDYITKAFSPRELVLRVDSLLRRARVALGPEQVFAIGGITVDTVWGVGYRMGEPRGER
jgi:two-component system response regulator ResD